MPVLASYVTDRERFGVSDEIMAHVVCLPVFVGLTEDEVEYVARSLKEALVDSSRS
jgi:dTDP-4-amino-4,6-dideoxygalactose transaminase